MALIVLKPKRAGKGETLVKSVKLDDEELPLEGTSFMVHDLGEALDVWKVITEAVPEPEIHCKRTLSTIDAHRLKSMGWTKV